MPRHARGGLHPRSRRIVTAREIFIEWLLPVVGIALLATAILLRKQLLGPEIINAGSPQVGVSLKANAFAFLIVAALATLAAPTYFAWVGYDRQLKELEAKHIAEMRKLVEQNARTEGGIEELRRRLQDLKTYDLRLILRFSDPADIDPQQVKVTQYLRSSKEASDRIYDPVTRWKSEPGGIVVYFNGLRDDDLIYVTVEYDGLIWRSPHMTMPYAQLVMEHPSARAGRSR